MKPPKRKTRSSTATTVPTTSSSSNSVKSKPTTTNKRQKKSHTASSTNIVTSGSLTSKFTPVKCQEWFNSFQLEDDGKTMGPEGIESLCEALNIPITDIKILILAYKLQAKNMGYFTREEWIDGMTRLQCDNTAKLANHMVDTKNNGLFNVGGLNVDELYTWAFKWAKESDQRCLCIETAAGLIKLILGDSTIKPKRLHVNNFVEFLEFKASDAGSGLKVLNKDQWNNFGEFSRSVGVDYEGFDCEGSWPVLLDEFVEWSKSLNKNSSKMDLM